MFFCLLSRSPLEYISPHICTYSTLLICAIYTSHLFCLESLAPRPNPPLPSVHLVAPELAKLLYLVTPEPIKLLTISTSLRPTLKDSLLSFLDHLWHLHNKSSTLCFSAHVLSINMVFAPESRSASSLVKSFRLLAGVIWIDRHIFHAGLTLRTNVSSEISSFVLFLLFFVEELSPGLMSLASPLGDPSDSKVELEIFLLSMESLLSSISSTDRTSYLLQLSAHPDWCLGPRLFPTSQPGFCNLWTRPLPCPKTFPEWT